MRGQVATKKGKQDERKVRLMEIRRLHWIEEDLKMKTSYLSDCSLLHRSSPLDRGLTAPNAPNDIGNATFGYKTES